jgi:diaminopimelate epimerase
VEKVADAGKKVSIETPAGIIAAQLHGELVTLNMSEPTNLQLNVRVSGGYDDKTIHFVNTGVPHVVIPVVNIEEIDVLHEGAAIRRHEMFSPKGANVNFLEKRGGNEIAIRTYERGVESETLACGTGVVASALIFAAMEKTDGPIGVLVRGGSELTVNFRRDGERFTDVTLTGPAEFVFEGAIEL